ncbi:GNAT family N-acetyltransferase [Erwinia sp.]|uniref:GNAT family N-acetyltransferase n=1 Tax=Erwinia citreus TaxID=558 RepID=UPI0028A16884|nr:GNAT family N-acetyltransferase [Erwinia sp.]
MFISVSDENDWEIFIDIFIEMERYHHGDIALTREMMGSYLQTRVFNKESGTEVHKVISEGSLVAFACTSVMYPAPRYAGQMFIKEIFVSERFRHLGVGKRLMSWLARRALDKGCLRLDWLSDKHNPGVQSFYQSVGGEVIESVNYFRLSGSGLDELAGKAK